MVTPRDHGAMTDRNHCPFCGEGYSPGRDREPYDRGEEWEMFDLLQLVIDDHDQHFKMEGRDYERIRAFLASRADA
jgi:hypothetical protein